MDRTPSELIIGYFKKSLDQEGMDEFYKWVNENPDNKKLFFEAKTIFDSISNNSVLDINDSWQRLLDKKNSDRQTKHTPFWKHMSKYAAVASIAIILTSAFFFFFVNNEFTPPSAEYISGDGIMDNASTALMTINGLYRYMFEFGQTTTSNYHQSFGPQSYILTADVMGDDHIMSGQGNGWFWFDHIYDVKRSYTSGGWRSYDVWNYGYTMASNVNYILAAKETIQGEKSDVDYVVGQAFALRAHAYNELAQFFARTYVGHEDEPGVPIYTEPTTAGTPGNPRSSLREVYSLIRADIDSAVNRLRGIPKQHSSHVDYNVANGFKARICLISRFAVSAIFDMALFLESVVILLKYFFGI